MKTFNIIIIGPQGSGKGTQAHKISKELGFYHLDAGKEIRKIAAEKTPLGRKVDDIINKQGGLVPYKIVVEVLEKTLKTFPKNQSIIFDGTPRRMAEVGPLEELLAKLGRSITHVFFLKTSKALSIQRLTHRLVCSKCGITFLDSVAKKTCLECQGKLVHRDDDNPKAIEERLRKYKQRTLPVIRHYRKQGRLITIDGSKTVQEVHNQIVQHL